MRLAVFGASGKVGQLVVKEALADGHQVVAFVHSHNPFDEVERLTVFKGDVKNKAEVVAALTDADSVISTLGSWGTKTKDVLSSAMASIIPAMEENKQKRIITLTGTGAAWSEDRQNWLQKLNHSFIKLINSKVLSDSERHIELLQQSKLDWTVVRSPIMNSKERRTYKLDFIEPAIYETVSRCAVARCMVDLLKNASYIRKAPHIHK